MSTSERSPIDQVPRGQGHSTVTSVRRARLIAIVAATIATSLIWLVGHVLGANFTVQASAKSITIDLPAVIGFTLCFSGSGWATLALLERYTRRPMTTWTLLAGSVYLVSVVPIFAEQATAGTRTALVLIHTSVAAILIPLLRRTARDTSAHADQVKGWRGSRPAALREKR
jgi:hypothetical protein